MLADRIEQIVTRRQLRDGDGAAIVELHRRVYTTQFGRDVMFVV